VEERLCLRKDCRSDHDDDEGLASASSLSSTGDTKTRASSSEDNMVDQGLIGGW